MIHATTCTDNQMVTKHALYSAAQLVLVIPVHSTYHEAWYTFLLHDCTQVCVHN